MSLHVHTFGSAHARPLVALHGLKGHGRRWRHFATRQLTDFHVYAPDLRGHGGSTQDPPWTLEQHAADVLQVIDRANLDRVDVIGHSLGATIAVHLARHAPDRIHRLVLLDPGIGLPPQLARHRADESLIAPVFDDPAQAAQARAAFWPPEAHHLIGDEVETHLAPGEDGRWRWRYSAAAAVATYSELARAAVTPPRSTPTLLVISSRGVVSTTYVAACRATLRDALTVVEMDSGHHIHLERADDTGRLVRGFLTPSADPVNSDHEQGRPHGA